MAEVGSKERAILERYRTKCSSGHALEEVFRVSTEDSVDAVVRRCTICGGVVVDREVDGRIMGQYVHMRFPESTEVLRIRLAVSA